MVEINGKPYEFRYSLRAMFVFETITEKPFEIKTMFDTYVFSYACLVSNPDNPSLDFNDYIDWCDTHPEVMDEFNDFLNREMRMRENLGSKKKVTGKARS